MSIRKSSLSLLIVFFTAICSRAQVFEGVVKDSRSKEKIAYVNIALLGTFTGTVSKFDGSFRLDLTDRPEGMDSIAFSIIGYQNKVLHVSELSKGMEVFLEPASVNLESVIVSPRSPEEYIQLAIEKIPDNYIKEAFNGTIYFRSVLRLNGKFVESQEAILKGYIMPVVGKLNDSTRLKLIAFRYYDEQEEAINSVRIKKRKKDKWAIEGIDTSLIEMTEGMAQSFGVYTQIDSNMIKTMYKKGYKAGKEKYFFENMVESEGRKYMTIGFRNRENMASHRGNLLLDEESLAFSQYNYQMKTKNLLIKSLLFVMGYGFNKADAVIKFTSIPTEMGWIPDLLQINFFVDVEKNRLFAKDIPIVIEYSSHISFLEVSSPATDLCIEGKILERRKHLKDQCESDPNHPAWEEYKDLIKNKKSR